MFRRLWMYFLMWWRGRSPPPQPPPDPLCSLDRLYQGTIIFGATGSGKSSGPFGYIARYLLQEAHAGILWLTAKVSEAERAEQLCRETGRLNDLVHFRPGSGLCMDPLEVELASPGASVESAAQLLDQLVQLTQRSGSSRGDEQFWALSSQRLFRRAIAGVFLTTGSARLGQIYAMIVSAAQSPEQITDPKWRANSFNADCLSRLSVIDTPEGALCFQYWAREWPALNPRTKSIIESMALNILDKFLSGPVSSLVCGETNFRPSAICEEGKVVVLGPSVLEAREPAQFFQLCVKTLVQRACLRRTGGRPVAILTDECQFFLVPQTDLMFQSVARQSRCAVLAATQTLPVLMEALGGGEAGRMDAEAWIGSLVTKIICQLSCPTSGDFFSRMIGTRKEWLMGGGSGGGEYDPIADMLGMPGATAQANWHESWEPYLRPHDFALLQPGGAGIVEAIVYQGGRTFSGVPYVRRRFAQQ